MRLYLQSWLPYALLALGATHMPLQAAQLNLAQSPPGAGREPAPNIIVSVDDSGSMGNDGITTLRAALRQTFAESNVADDRIRLAWQSMNRCRGIPSSDLACLNLNGMRPLQGTHRTNFLNWVNGLIPSGGTPSHLMIDEAGKYLSATNLGINSPWASNPGTQETPLLSCRKSFHIFMTDGGWNSAATVTTGQVDTAGPNGQRITRGGNADNTSTTLPDGVEYSNTSAQTRLYRDTWGANGLSTLSDLAFYYWSRDLQPGLTNNVRASPRDQLPAENFGTTATPATLESYWNPRNNPATWQHMVNYTIGFNDAAEWTGTPDYIGDTFSGLSGLIRGTTTWPSPFCGTGSNQACDGASNYGVRDNNRKVELWHAALNSRGRFVPAPNAAALVNAFQGILDDILTQTSNPLVSIASSSSRLRTDGNVYIGGFNSERWSGDLSAYAIASGTNVVSASPTWSAANLMNAASFSVTNRLVLTTNSETQAGVTFLFNNVSDAQRTALRGGDSATIGSNRVNYLRGDRSLETQNSGGTMRQRDSRLGDIVNSNIWYAGRPLRMPFEHAGHADFRTTYTNRTATVYVGANDGMLHAFNASTGQELMAYVPLGVYSNLRNYTLPNYGHRYFVDGHPFTGDVDVSLSGTGNSATPSWKTMLVSGLGAGGKGYFVLDVTNPVTSGSVASTFTTTGVVMDTTDGGDSDMGYIYSLPVVDVVTGARTEQIVKLNNGRWAVVMGNGVNSTNERPVLLIQYLDGSRELLKIVANSTNAQSNGLSAPRLIDVNGDGKMDIAYAGDLQGNLWKFNLTSTTPADWGVSNWSGDPAAATCKNVATCRPLYVAQDGATTPRRQPITSAPLWMSHPLGGVQVLFGTGQNVQELDRSNTNTQTLYSVWDKSTYQVASGVLSAVDANNITTGRAALVQQTITGNVTSTATGTAVTTDYSNTSANAVAYSRADNSARRGWFMDLTAGERVLTNPQLFEGQKIIASTTLPRTGSTGETCDFGGVSESNWVNVLNMISGAPAKTPVFSTTDTTVNLTQATRARFGSGEFISVTKSNGDLDLISFDSSGTIKKTLTGEAAAGSRADWREAR